MITRRQIPALAVCAAVALIGLADAGASTMRESEIARYSCTVHESGHVQVFGRRHDVTIHALMQPATEKRQGTKSRAVGHWLAASAMGI
jgi:hypothetical protein